MVNHLISGEDICICGHSQVESWLTVNADAEQVLCGLAVKSLPACGRCKRRFCVMGFVVVNGG